MTSPRLSRREALISTLIAGSMAGATPAVSRAGSLLLRPLPTRLYKTRDAGREQTESWTFSLNVQSTENLPFSAQTMQVRMFKGEQLLKTMTYSGEGLAALATPSAPRPRSPDGSEPPQPLFGLHGIRMRCTEPAASGVDSMAIDLRVVHGTEQRDLSIVLPVETYQQKTPLIFPFRGTGIVANAGVTNGGHRNRSGQFALDVLGMTEDYAIYLPGADRNNVSASYAGWARDLIAPAAGVVVRARSDRPDQPDPENSDPAYYAPEHPDGGDPGNYLVIDHGQGEFSMMAHLLAGSVRVSLGDRVSQGQVVGKLGSSGDTVTPHIHYQLQTGPDWQFADALPCTFSNIGSPLARGAFFNAR